MDANAVPTADPADNGARLRGLREAVNYSRNRMSELSINFEF
jgi:hypothetical protein